MSTRHRLPVRLLAAVVGLLVWAMLGGVSTAGAAAVTIDGIAFTHLPPGLGDASDFRYENDDVAFVSRTWESARPGGGFRVDADLIVMRGARLRDGPALRDWFVAYEDRPPAEARYVPVRVHGRPGWLGRDQVFWLVRPGLAVSVHVDGSRWTTLQVARTAWSAREVGR
jgi:hypothetical protein